ncbi:hypothetical protein OKW42_004550 [Paraburkholderia sp. WC7.3d]
MPGDAIHGRGEGGRCVVVVEERERVGNRDAQWRVLQTAREQRPGVTVVRVVEREPVEHLPGIGDVVREHRQRIERAACRHDAALADEPERRLEPHQPVEARRHASGTRGIGAERERDDARRDRNRRTGARSARHVFIARDLTHRAVRRTRADETRRELIEIGLADENRACVQQTRYRERRFARRVGEGIACGGGRQAGEVDVVLHRERHAAEWHAGEERRAFVGEQTFEFGGARDERGFGHAKDPRFRTMRGGKTLQHCDDRVAWRCFALTISV